VVEETGIDGHSGPVGRKGLELERFRCGARPRTSEGAQLRSLQFGLSRMEIE
jgi:hypothetical protein